MKISDDNGIAETIMTYEIHSQRISLWRIDKENEIKYCVLSTLTGKLLECLGIQHALDIFDLTVQHYKQEYNGGGYLC